MNEYRAYLVGIDDHFVGFEDLICRDDDEAIAKAKRLVDGHDIEVWSGKRFVVRLESKRNRAASVGETVVLRSPIFTN